ncbi:low molecular weight phosphatase family protein [Curtobacterium sp. MWU13-2055]|uniref:arsenate reductase/protein-tyrosine-phosphatase family protein n=1 Tax=Curtobacterium sp. MWU13-2055 TaxID=2931928 RepID=UPI00200C9E51|nr:low molecular weight phosphatase family protein [Curtobacterium sp. MWU13-2055]
MALRPEPQPTFTILTVCTGNICRSPLAEQYLRAGLAGLDHVELGSAGTMASDGDRMPTQAQSLSRAYGGVPDAHRARFLFESHVSGADLVLAMAREHRRAVVAMHPRASRYTFTLREFARLAGGLTDEDLFEVARMPQTASADRLRAVVALVAARRGFVPNASDPVHDDVVDPYRRSDSVYEASAQQLVPAADIVIRALGRAVNISVEAAR